MIDQWAHSKMTSLPWLPCDNILVLSLVNREFNYCIRSGQATWKTLHRAACMLPCTHHLMRSNYLLSFHTNVQQTTKGNACTEHVVWSGFSPARGWGIWGGCGLGVVLQQQLIVRWRHNWVTVLKDAVGFSTDWSVMFGKTIGVSINNAQAKPSQYTFSVAWREHCGR